MAVGGGGTSQPLLIHADLSSTPRSTWDFLDQPDWHLQLESNVMPALRQGWDMDSPLPRVEVSSCIAGVEQR